MKDCKIVQDLMPNYIDNLTSKDSNEYVENHLKECKECTNYFNEMKSKIELDNTATVKQEIDYMKKAKKKMNIGKKLLTIVGLLIAISVIMFWREAYTLMCYADICNKYIFWQEQVIEKGNYSVRENRDNNLTYIYYTPEKMVRNSTSLNNGDTHKIAILKNSDIEGQSIFYTKGNVHGEDVVAKLYQDANIVTFTNDCPYNYMFDFENKANFWELMSTITHIRGIWIEKINETKYYVIEERYGREIYINKATGLVEEIIDNNDGTCYYRIEVGNVTEKQLDFPSKEDKIVLGDYELENRNKDKTNEKISNSEAEAGTIISYNFKVENSEEDFSEFMQTTDPNLMLMKITNNTTYKRIQERFKGLRDLTDEDFENYFVLLVIDKDNTKEIAFSKYETQGITPYKILTVSEKAVDSNQYSGSLVIIPNSEDVPGSGATIFGFDARIE